MKKGSLMRSTPASMKQLEYPVHGEFSELTRDIQNRKCLDSNPGYGDLGVKWVSNAVINIGLVRVPLDSWAMNGLMKIFNMKMNSHVKILSWQLEEG